MSPSTLLLLRHARFRIGTAMIAIVGISALMVASQPIRDLEYPPIIVWLSIAGAAAMMLPTMFRNLLAPVTSRQTAWMPLGAAAAMIAAGLATLTFVQFARGIAFWEFVAYWKQSFPTCVYSALVMILFWRLIRFNPGFAGFAAFGGTVPVIGKNEHFIAAGSIAAAACPAAIALLIFLIWEAPKHFENLERMGNVQTKEHFFAPAIPDMSAPSRPSWETRLADSLTFGLTGLAGVAATWFIFLSGAQVATRELIQKNPFMLSYLFIFIVPVYFGIAAWRQNRASGMSMPRAVIVLLLRATIFLEPWKDKLGVRAGKPIQCEDCRDWRFGWQKHCPHCASGAKSEKPMIPLEASGWLRGLRYDPLAMFYRAWGPLYVAAFILIRNVRWFK